MGNREEYKIDPVYLRQYQWVSIPSTLALLFIALTKGSEGIGYWATLLIGGLIYNLAWFCIYEVTIVSKSPANKKQYYFSFFVLEVLFVGLCLYYVLGI